MAAWEVFNAEMDRGLTPDKAVVAARRAFQEAGGGEWQWFDRGLIEMGLLKDVKIRATHSARITYMYAHSAQCTI